MLRSVAVAFTVVCLAACCLAASPQPVGMLSSASVGALITGVAVPSGTAVYKGDVIEARLGSAIFTLTNGASLTVCSDGRVRVMGSDSVELLKGMSRVESRSSGVTLVASNWVLGARPNTKTDVVIDSSGVSLMVGQGQVFAKNLATKEVLVADNSRPILLPAAAAPEPQGQAPAPPASGPSGHHHTSAKIVGAYVIGAAAIAVGAAAIATRSSVSQSQVDALQTQQQSQASQISTLQSQLAAAQSTLTSLSASNTSLTTTVNSLRTQLTTLQTQASQLSDYDVNMQNLVKTLSGSLATLQTTQASLATNQAQINALIQIVAAGTPLTAAQQQQLAALQATQATLTAQVSSLAAQAASAAAAVTNSPKPPGISIT
jgi:peptidoglycan hydrolase CwlO-like protein